MRAALKASFGSPMPAEFTAGDRMRSQTSWTNPDTIRLAPTPMKSPNVEDRSPRSRVRAVSPAADFSTNVFKYKELLSRRSFAMTSNTTPQMIRSSLSFLLMERVSIMLIALDAKYAWSLIKSLLTFRIIWCKDARYLVFGGLKRGWAFIRDLN